MATIKRNQHVRVRDTCLTIQISDVDTAESFLSQVISSNRPRVILFSPHRNPSVRYKLAAFANQRVASSAFVSTHQSWLNRQLLSKFKVERGDKELLVFKDGSLSEEPSLYFEVSESTHWLALKIMHLSRVDPCMYVYVYTHICPKYILRW